MKIIIVSPSPDQLQILGLIGIKPTPLSINIDEDLYQEIDPYKRIVSIARAKARIIAQTEKKAIIIAVDSYAYYRGQLIGKPKYKMEALSILEKFSGKSHTFLSGWAIVKSSTNQEYTGISETKITMNDLVHQELVDYVNDHDVVKWTAGYHPLNTQAIYMVKKIEGSLTGFTHGLPLEMIYPILRKEHCFD